jgi:hypothetical protein
MLGIFKNCGEELLAEQSRFEASISCGTVEVNQEFQSCAGCAKRARLRRNILHS